MQLRLIDARTRLEIQLEVKDKDGADSQAVLIYGEFFEMEEGASFYVICDELYARFNDLEKSKMKFTFSHCSEEHAYTFEGKMRDALVKDGKKLILATATSMIEKTNRRGAPRIKAGIATKIYELAEGAPKKAGKLIGEGVTYDISITGVSFLTNRKLDLLSGLYVVEFSLFPPEVFHLPIKYVRSGDNPRSSEYEFDYAFMFACEHNSPDINSLTHTLFRYKMDMK